MGWTKQQLVQEAFAEIAMAGYTFDLNPEEMETGLRRLDTMLATWNGKGIRLGYPLPSSPDTSSLDQDSNLPDMAIEAVYLSLAISMAPGFGKMVTQDTRIRAKQAYDSLIARAAMPPEQQFRSGLPRGAGGKSWRGARSPFLPGPTDPIAAGGDGPIDFN